MEPYPLPQRDDRLSGLDGFRVAWDSGQERADILLDRPPLDIVTMRERDQLAAVFELLDRDPAVHTAKHVIDRGLDASLQVATELEGEAYGCLRGSENFAEGVHAFHEKRRPVFRGR